MLGELTIQNLAVIEKAELKFGPGLNILSGEEGSGKSLVVDALSLLLGARAPLGLIRSGAPKARVEGVFWLSPDTSMTLLKLLEENDIAPETDGTLIIGREISEQGRSVARVNGRPVTVSTLKEIGCELVDLNSQMEHLSLLDGHRQLNLLDTFGSLNQESADLSRLVDSFRQKSRELSIFTAEKVEGKEELLSYQLQEIENAGLKEGEEEALIKERELLLHAESLKEGCLKAYESLYGSDSSASSHLHRALLSLRGLSAIDNSLSVHRERLEESMTNLEETARELSRYAEAIEADESRLEAVEHRLDLLASLKRKYGNSITDILNQAEKIKTELEQIQNYQEKQRLLQMEKMELENKVIELAETLSKARQKAAISLVTLVNGELAALGLPGARFNININQEESQNGLKVKNGRFLSLTREGMDRVEFIVQTNPGEPFRPLAMVASGGEMCRLMLAIKSALKNADPVPILVFDEMDIGIGGRHADTVGKKLSSLAALHQVICITHLPQVACFGDQHFRLVKEKVSGRSSTAIQELSGENRVLEIAAMLGSDLSGNMMLKGATELLCRSKAWKDAEVGNAV